MLIQKNKVTIVCEMSQTYEGKFDVASKLVGAAIDAKADAIKFQVFKADELGTKDYKHYDLFTSLEFTPEQWGDLIKQAQDGGILAFADVFGLESAQMLIEKNIDGYANFFGVSGYSGAGSKLNERNNKDTLKDNVLPYSLVKHLHEKEVNHHSFTKVFFSPHVGNFFRGILITANFTLKENLSLEEVKDNFTKFYKSHDLIKTQLEIPNIKEVAGTSLAIIGGFQCDSDNKRLSFCCVIDNLLKGAATQAIQNLNSAFGWDDNLGV